MADLIAGVPRRVVDEARRTVDGPCRGRLRRGGRLGGTAPHRAIAVDPMTLEWPETVVAEGVLVLPR
ncbi:hypothetical protein [Dactylosporangium sp. NPDC051541]|uniref:hypothetical protein n=1 Tax=Dactylosporangium sp. NPDC051541 TaxID=3363977 RepID=UPI0037A15BD9